MNYQIFRSINHYKNEDLVRIKKIIQKNREKIILYPFNYNTLQELDNCSDLTKPTYWRRLQNEYDAEDLIRDLHEPIEDFINITENDLSHSYLLYGEIHIPYNSSILNSIYSTVNDIKPHSNLPLQYKPSFLYNRSVDLNNTNMTEFNRGVFYLDLQFNRGIFLYKSLQNFNNNNLNSQTRYGYSDDILERQTSSWTIKSFKIVDDILEDLTFENMELDVDTYLIMKGEAL